MKQLNFGIFQDLGEINDTIKDIKSNIGTDDKNFQKDLGNGLNVNIPDVKDFNKNTFSSILKEI